MLSRFKLQHILFLAFTLIASFPVIILGYWVQQVALEKEVSAVKEKHLLLAKNITRDLSRYVKDVESSFNLVIANLNNKSDIKNISSHLNDLDIRYIHVVDHAGNIINQIPSTNNAKEKIDNKIWKALKETIAKAKITQKIIYSNLIRTTEDETTFFLVKAINDTQLAIAALSTTYIIETQKEISFGRRGHVAIVDSTGRAIAHPVAKWVKNMKDMSMLPPVKQMMKGNSGVSKFYTPAMKGDVIAGYTTVKATGWGVMVPQPFEELIERTQSTQNTTFIIMFIGIAVAGLISWYLAGLLVIPIHAVISATKFSKENKHELILPVEISTSTHFIPKEFIELMDSFNSMGQRLNTITTQLYSKIDFSNKELQEQNLKLKEQSRELIIVNKELERLSTTDNLTNLFNRRLFDEIIDTELAFAIRHTEFLSLVILDIDFFKAINDKYGHIQGDRVLIDIANLLKTNIRVSDVAFRIGGDEFAILCRRTNHKESKAMVENIRKSLEQLEIKVKDEVFSITGSFGIATLPNDDFDTNQVELFYRYADKAMYNSKNQGRNRVTHYQDIVLNAPTNNNT